MNICYHYVRQNLFILTFQLYQSFFVSYWTVGCIKNHFQPALHSGDTHSLNIWLNTGRVLEDTTNVLFLLLRIDYRNISGGKYKRQDGFFLCFGFTLFLVPFTAQRWTSLIYFWDCITIIVNIINHNFIYKAL